MKQAPNRGIRDTILAMRIGGVQLREILYPAYVRIYPLLHRMRRFEYNGRTYEYMFHPYGATLRAERIVEVPIALRELRAHAGRSVLEVGNVLSHYVRCNHLVVDKYEAAEGVVNQDIMEFQPSHRFDFIVSVSTVEHIGWDEHEQAPERAAQALEHMRGMLAPGGTMLVTIPWGYNPALTSYLQGPDCLFTEVRYMRRTSRKNTWVETDAAACANAKYGEPYPFGNVVALGYATPSPQVQAAEAQEISDLRGS